MSEKWDVFMEMIAAERAEQELYRNHSDSYGYVFYIGEKR